MRSLLLFVLLLGTTIASSQSYSNKNLCLGVKKIVSSLTKKGDWLSSAKGKKINPVFMSATTYNSKIYFNEALENVVVVWRNDTVLQKGDYYFTATFARAKSFDSLHTQFSELSKSLKACYPKATVEEDFSNRYADGDGYLTLRLGELKISLDMYANSNVADDKVILLTIMAR
ncbi:MAG: hypothetical protein K0Q66_108 [Chitinophagaceae bacterium]|jgi:hypothetical protein|nr:hypothetical protein [Chitinophagaceae bacterium]